MTKFLSIYSYSYIIIICFTLITCESSGTNSQILLNIENNLKLSYTNNHTNFFSSYFNGISLLQIASLKRNNNNNVNNTSSSVVEKLNKITKIKNNQEYNRVLDFISELLPKVFPYMDFPIMVRRYFLNDEVKIFDHTERFAWNGKKFDLRPGQCNCTELNTNHQRILKEAEVFYKTVGIIVVIDDIKILDEYTIGMPRPPFQNPCGNYVVNILSSWNLKDFKIISNLLTRLWRLYGILRMVFIFNGEIEKLFYLDPFQLNVNGKYGKIFSENFGNNSKSFLISKPDYPITFNGYPLKVFFFDRYPSAMNWTLYPMAFLKSYQSDAKYYSTLFGGFDGIYIGNIAKLLNFTIITKYPHLNETGTKYGVRGRNGTIEGSVGHVMYSRVSIGGNCHFIQGYGTVSVSFLNIIYYDLLCLITAKAKPIPKSMAVINCFETDLWIVICISCIILGGFWYICRIINYDILFILRKQKRRQNDIIKYKKYYLTYNIINMWLLLTCQSINIQKTKGFERLFLIGCMMSSILFSSTLQGYLSKTFFSVTYEKDIKTLEELNDANIKIVVPSAAFNNLFGNRTHLKGYLKDLDRKVLINELDQQQYAINYRNIAFVERKSDFDVIKAEFEFPNGTTGLNLVEECFRMTFLSFIIRRGWPFEEKINRIIGLMDSGGFRFKWFAWSKQAILLKWRVKNLKIMVDNYRHKPFSVDDIKIALLGHLLGNILAFLIFIIEKMFYELRKCVNKYKKH